VRTRPPVRTAAASKLRALADRLAPFASAPPPSPAPLVRLGGRWWYRGELLSEPSRAGSPALIARDLSPVRWPLLPGEPGRETVTAMQGEHTS
jgi:hypothetical protein